MDKGVEKPSKQKDINRREVLIGAAATMLTGATSVEAASGSAMAEKLRATEQSGKNLSPKQERTVNEILDRAVGKWNTMGRTLLFDTANGALANNYKQFVIVHTFGSRHLEKEYAGDKAVIASRDQLIQSEFFKLSFLKALLRKGYFKELSPTQEKNLDKTDESYSTFREYTKRILGEEPNWSGLSDSHLTVIARRLSIGVKYNASSRGEVTCVIDIGWQ